MPSIQESQYNIRETSTQRHNESFSPDLRHGSLVKLEFENNIESDGNVIEKRGSVKNSSI